MFHARLLPKLYQIIQVMHTVLQCNIPNSQKSPYLTNSRHLTKNVNCKLGKGISSLMRHACNLIKGSQQVCTIYANHPLEAKSPHQRSALTSLTAFKGFTWVQWQSSWPCPANPRFSEATSNHLPEYLIGSKLLADIPLIIICIPLLPSDAVSRGRVIVLSVALASWQRFWWWITFAIATYPREHAWFDFRNNKILYYYLSSVPCRQAAKLMIICYSSWILQLYKRTSLDNILTVSLT